MVNQILVEESVIGWEELEVEVVRDKAGKKISICFIENIDQWVCIQVTPSALHQC